jgi:putative membrane protein
LYQLDYGTAATISLWMLTMLITPVLENRWGWPGLRIGLTSTIVLQSLAACIILSQVWPPTQVAMVAFGIVAGGWIVEYVGISTGWPFGNYAYTPRLQPQVGGIPLVIAIAYLGILVPAWGIADFLAVGSRGPTFIIGSAVAATAWDLFLDPQLVYWRVWVWQTKGSYFGIPWRNFVAWLGVTSAFTILFQPSHLEALPLVLIYTTAWIMELIALQIRWSLRGPALVGGIIMGGVVGGAWLRFLS